MMKLKYWSISLSFIKFLSVFICVNLWTINLMNNEKSLQETFAPNGICFGCGVANEKGLRIRSFENEAMNMSPSGLPKMHHQAFPGMLNGGIIGSLARLSFKLDGGAFPDEAKPAKQRPTAPSRQIIRSNFCARRRMTRPFILKAKVVESTDTTATVEAELIANDKVCATCKGLFVIVKEGHPAYHRW